MATNSFIQVPPDSTGKKLHHVEHTIDAVTTVIPGYHLTDPNIPSRKQTVSYRGGATIAFPDGEPSLDAFGNVRVSNANALGYYDFVADPQNDLFWDKTVAGGSLTHSRPYMLARVGSGSTDYVRRSTTRYHFYQPGVGNLVIQTLALSDTGKLGNIRRWGYGDDQNAMFWQLNDAWDNVRRDHFSVNIRSNIGGSIVENRVNRIDWNGDKLDGNGVSGFQMALDGRMYYWIDFAWLGVGTVRFGVLGTNGERITCHTFQHPAGEPIPYTATAALPLFWENYNYLATSGTSDIRMFCGAVYSEDSTNYNFWRFSDIESAPKTVTTDTPIVSLRPKLTFNSVTNRTGIYPDEISVIVSGGDVRLAIMDDTTLTGATWAISGDGCTEGDVAATAISGGTIFKVMYLSQGCHNIAVADHYETNDEGYHVWGDGLSAQTLTIVATKFNGTTVTVGANISYRELR